MFSTSDTIVAIATPQGRGGIGVVRLSGPTSADIAMVLLGLDVPLQPRHATLARTAGDQVVATYFAAPHSYTGEHVVEVSAHGSPVVLRQIVERALQAGARLAEPGEFTLRAFLNGKIDLVQAEAVADLIDAATPLQARAAFDQLEGTLTDRIDEIGNRLFDLIARLEASLDFPDEGYHFAEPNEATMAMRAITADLALLVCDARRGRLIREGARVVLTGKPNVGKSSLFNALLRAGRAIVTPVPGTTRDLLTERADIDGLLLELTDTAGVRNTGDTVEIEGVARARRALATADLAIVVLDRSQPLEADDEELLAETASMKHLVVANKADLPAVWSSLELPQSCIEISAVSGAGVDDVRKQIRTALEGPSRGVERDVAAVTNVRHAALLERAHQSMTRACDGMEMPGGPVGEEFVLTDLQEARAALEEVTGRRTSEDMLRHIFSRFCIGK
jgi:tRNA modification GTPase